MFVHKKKVNLNWLPFIGPTVSIGLSYITEKGGNTVINVPLSNQRKYHKGFYTSVFYFSNSPLSWRGLHPMALGVHVAFKALLEWFIVKINKINRAKSSVSLMKSLILAVFHVAFIKYLDRSCTTEWHKWCKICDMVLALLWLFTNCI